MDAGNACNASLFLMVGTGCRSFHTLEEEEKSLRMLTGTLPVGGVGSTFLKNKVALQQMTTANAQRLNSTPDRASEGQPH